MAGDPPNQHPPSSTSANPADQQVHLEAKAEDAETRAAREELKHAAISDKQQPSQGPADHQTQRDNGDDISLRVDARHEHARDRTPDVANSAAGENKPSSPKKKRAHDEVDQNKETEGNRSSSGTESEGWVVVDGGDQDKEHRSEPQKKRARDETSPPADIHKVPQPLDQSTTEATSKDVQQPQTSTAAFAASGFAKLASSSSSPFASAGASKSVFGGGASGSASPFAKLGAASPSKFGAATNAPAPTLSFGNKDASAPSPFAAVNGSSSSAFGAGTFGGSSFGGGSAFGSVLGGSKTGNFASPGAPPITKSDKPAKPFGAPESDAEDESDDGSDSEGEEGRGSAAADGEKKDDTATRDEVTPAGGEDEKKAKYKKVVVDDGEAGEATIIQVRTRMYYLDKTTSADGKTELAWRERGAGMLKINVPVDSVTIDPESGSADPKSFDPTVLKESTPDNLKLVRLLMRQDSTLRVILNTAMTKSMKFEFNDGLKAKSVLFTALEGEDAKPVQVQMKMSVQSADNFLKAVEGIQEKMKTQES